MEMACSTNALDISTPTHDLKFMMASNINVFNFISVKLSGHNNYKIWKGQMLCLLESQVLLHMVNAERTFPVDKGIHMILQYDKLVKGWFFGSVNEKVLKDLVDLDTAQEVWVKLESLFNPPVSDSKGHSSNAPDVSALDVIAPVVSAMREDLKYIQALTVDVSSFVSDKLVGEINYYIWKTEMLNLIGSHDLLPIIHDKPRFPWDEGDPVTQKYDSLVRGWILNSMNENRRDEFRMYRSVQLMWKKLESTFTYQPERSECTDDETEALKYIDASNVKVFDIVSVKLSDASNYSIWRAQMLYLLESHSLLHILDPGRLQFSWDKYDKLVKDWIFHTMNDELLKDFPDEDRSKLEAKELWEKLESHFRDCYSRLEPVDFASTQNLKYTQALNANVSSFVSVRLSGRSNYKIWKAQMLCLIGSQELLHIIHETTNCPMTKYDSLVKGWILSTMNNQLLKEFTDHDKAETLWRKLELAFNPEKRDSDTEDKTSPGFKFERTESPRVPEIGDMDSWKIKKELYEAAVEGCWWKAKSILKIHKNAATEAVTADGQTILHLAIELGHNYFLEKLLEFIKPEKDIETKNSKGQTVLHIAAAVGNTYAAQLLVQNRIQLLQILDGNKESPLNIAYNNTKVHTCAYLLESALSLNSNDHFNENETHGIISAIVAKNYDLAKKMLKKFQECAGEDVETLLMAITITFPTSIGFIESFIYPSFNNVQKDTILRCSSLFHPNFLDKCDDDILRVVKIFNITCCSWLGKTSMILYVLVATVYPIYHLMCLLILLLRLPFSMLYFHMWKVLAITVHPIKNIEKKRKEHEGAKEILSLIYNQMDTSNGDYRKPLFEAVRQDIHEVVDRILYKSPAKVNCKDEEGHNIIQLAIINRAEKVYKLVYHIIERTKSLREITDSSENNLVHLVGRLAPPFILQRTTGAALQLQRELLWREEVEKLFIPLELRKENKNGDTPAMVFTREHVDLMKEGECWMKNTAESCSITAALGVTVVFAAAITIPGGSNQESGLPIFEKEIAFTIFALSNAFSMFTAATALLLFLSILTTRFSEKDFLVSLPRRLIFGLLMLFLSTTAMMVSFGAILFLVFCDQRPWMLAPICGFTFFTILVMVTIKLPLLVDLIKSTYFPIFGKQSYLESCKINRKSTIFTE